MSTHHVDFLLPPEMALQAESVGVAKVNMPVTKTLVLSILAGAFIALGAVFSATVTAGSAFPYGVTRLIGGLVFSLGLILVIVGGAELFTGNNLIIMAWANKKINTLQVIRNWVLVFAGNTAGSLFIVLLMFFARQYLFGGTAVGINYLNIAKAKCELGFVQAMSLGVLCNILVCLAVWLCYSATSTSGKILAIIFPISAFVASGFEHSIANLFYIPYAIAILNFGTPQFISYIQNDSQLYDSVTVHNFIFSNLVPVTLGNMIGGALLVGLVYWFVFLRNKNSDNTINNKR